MEGAEGKGIAMKAAEDILEKIACDPIILFYLKMSKPTEYKGRLPQYSETRLRLAIKQIRAHAYIRLHNHEVELYKKILLFRYYRDYKTIQQLLTIMNDFSQQDIVDCFDRFGEIIEEWHKFIIVNLRDNMYKDAFIAIMYEWARRSYRINGQLLHHLIDAKATAILWYLSWDLRLLKLYVNSFKTKLSHSNLMKETINMGDLTKKDLITKNIVNDIRHQFNPLILDFVGALNENKLYNTKITERKAILSPLRAHDFLTIPKMPIKKRILETPEMAEIPSLVKKPKIEVLNVEVIKTNIDLNGLTEVKIEQTEEIPSVHVKQESNTDEVDVAVAGYIKKTESEAVNENVKIEKSQDENMFELAEIEASSDTDLSCSTESDIECVMEDSNSIQSEQAEEAKPTATTTIDYKTAISYIAALQRYAVCHGHLESISLLDKVDTAFRKKHKK